MDNILTIALSKGTLMKPTIALLQQAGFAPTVVYVYSGYRSGTVVGTSPRGQATRGSVVQILVSKGSPPPAPAPAPAPAPDPAAPPAPPAAPAG